MGIAFAAQHCDLAWPTVHWSKIQLALDVRSSGPTRTTAWVRPSCEPPAKSRDELAERLISHFEHPETAPWDWDALREGKRLAWPLR